MIDGLLRSRIGRVAGAAVLVGAGLVFTSGHDIAFADASAPPPFSSLKNCPGASGPALGAPRSAAFTPYQVPFKAIIFDGELKMPPDLVVPHVYATACGTVQLPQLTGHITSENILVSPTGTNLYIAGLEALPATVRFIQGLTATIDLQPAHNGGLDIATTGPTTASVTTLGFTCGVTIDPVLTTKGAGSLQGQPVTGPTEQGQAEVVSDTFTVPAVVGSDTGSCPPSVAQTFNKVLGLPAAPGVASFVAPFCFDFELMGINQPPATRNCPWPQS